MKNPNNRYRKLSAQDRFRALASLSDATTQIARSDLNGPYGVDVGWIAHTLGEALSSLGMTVKANPGHDGAQATLNATLKNNR